MCLKADKHQLLRIKARFLKIREHDWKGRPKSDQVIRRELKGITNNNPFATYIANKGRADEYQEFLLKEIKAA